MQKYFTFIIFISIHLLVSSQYEKCATQDILMQNIDVYGSILQEQIDELKAQNNIYKSGGIYTIPVVFHIIHNGDSIGENENLSDEVILAQLAALNRDFRALNEDSSQIPTNFKPFFSNTQIEFCLAKIRPNGSFTNGIERYNFNQDGWDLDSINSYVKPNTIWNRNDYLNIWSINFKGNLESSLINGFAQPPLASLSSQTDGIVVRFDKIYSNGRVAVHEVGHWLGLFHIWGDDNGLCSNDLGGGNDGIDDTPDQGGPYYNCPNGTPQSCGSVDMFMNYMDYTNDDCSLLFTHGQKNAMHQVLENFRQSLQLSSVCKVPLDLKISNILTPNTTVCQQSFYPHILVENDGTDTIKNFTINFLVNDIIYETKTWDETIAPNEEVSLFFSQHFFNSGIQNEAKFEITSVNNSSTEYSLNNQLTIDFFTVNTGLGIETPYIENFENTPLSNLNIQNFDNSNTWAIINEVDFSAIFMENYNYVAGEIDNILTGDFKIDGNNPILNFEYAYNAINETIEDTFTIYASQNCGIHWIKIWQKSGLDLSNEKVEVNYFLPTLADFVPIEIDMSFLNSLEKIRFKFENKSGAGNNLYLKNFEIIYTLDDTLSVYFLKNYDFIIYPNPTQNKITITLKTQDTYHLLITDLLGKKIVDNSFYDTEYHIDIQHLQKGVYYLKIQSEDGNSKVKPFIVR